LFFIFATKIQQLSKEFLFFGKNIKVGIFPLGERKKNLKKNLKKCDFKKKLRLKEIRLP
jgi:hypothetical protein